MTVAAEIYACSWCGARLQDGLTAAFEHAVKAGHIQTTVIVDVGPERETLIFVSPKERSCKN